MNADHHISSYSSIYALGHKAIASILDGEVTVEEKIDGSQFSMCRVDGELFCRSKGATLIIDHPEKMFSAAIETAKVLDLHDGWLYRCEYLSKPKHNTLAYARIPKNHLILFDVMTAPETYLNHAGKEREAERLGLESVPLVFAGRLESFDKLQSVLDRDSILGGVKIEGVVVKNYSLFTADKKIAIAKYVSEDFKEKHQLEWKKSNPQALDVVEAITASLRREARWSKAVQHLRDAEILTASPKDIGALIKEVGTDTFKEEQDAIKESLFNYAWPKISRGIVAGLPEWYKAQLAQGAF